MSRKLSDARREKLRRLHRRDCPGTLDIERTCRQCVFTRDEFMANPGAVSQRALDGSVTIVGDDGIEHMTVTRRCPPLADND